jgi:uncharacterized protein YccT (UPF0319 family)
MRAERRAVEMLARAFAYEDTLAPDGDSFESTIRLQLLDKSGSPVELGSVAAAKASRIRIR